MPTTRHSSSFRDPSGFLFRREGRLLRQVNRAYADDFRLLAESGLYSELVDRGWLVEHREVDAQPADPELAHAIIEPREVPFVSYPYEWSFGQYRDAALRTLDIQKLALERGMTLKDASAYNIQFFGSRPVLIDTLSFTRYEEGAPWVAYRQFCQHFLAPVALASYCDIRLTQLMRSQIDGIPLDLACSLLPARARLRFPLLTHLFLHAGSQRRKATSDRSPSEYKVARLALEGLIESLRKGVARLDWRMPDTEWGDYYSATNYSDRAREHKRELLDRFLERIEPTSFWDLGANTGQFSRLASRRGAATVAFDIDPVAVEKNYREARRDDDALLLPLRLDLTNPSPALGWAHAERQSLAERGPADAVAALALVHHLAIGNNVPLDEVASYLARLCKHLIIEFVPKEDSQVQRLLATREDVFHDYHLAGFEAAFEDHFEPLETIPVEGSERTLHLFGPRE